MLCCFLVLLLRLLLLYTIDCVYIKIYCCVAQVQVLPQDMQQCCRQERPQEMLAMYHYCLQSVRFAKDSGVHCSTRSMY
jgi:hypothetical protein